MTTSSTLLRRALVLFVLALLLPATAPAQHFPDDEDLRVMLDYLVADGETPGIVFAVVEADGTTRILTAGSAGPDSRPLGPRSVFEIGSINKTFTGVLLADMVVRGEVALDDPVAKYLPDSVRVPSRNGKQITLLDLATHRSGLPRLPDNHRPADMADPYADYTIETLYQFLSNHELRRDPGAEYEYSNLGFGLLGHALARAAGTSYRALLRERILEPLGMTMTGYALEGEIAEWMVKGHSDNGGRVVPYWFTTEAIEGAGGLRSNIEDMLAYLKANLDPPEGELGQALRLARRLQRPVDENYGIGLGWRILPLEGRRLIAHGGATGGFSTMIGFDPDLGVGFVMLANAARFEDDLGLDLLRFGRPLDLAEVAVPGEVLDRYAGLYEFAPGRPVVVRHEDGDFLTIQTPDNVRSRMYADSDTSFYLKRAPWRVHFLREADGGPVTGLVLAMDGGRTRTLRKTSDEAPPPGAEPPVLDLPVSDTDIARYAGTYRLTFGERTLDLRVFGQGPRLMAQATGQRITALRYQGEHVFVPDFDDDVRLVFTVEAGRAVRVMLYQGGGEVVGERVR